MRKILNSANWSKIFSNISLKSPCTKEGGHKVDIFLVWNFGFCDAFFLHFYAYLVVFSLYLAIKKQKKIVAEEENIISFGKSG